MDFAKHIVYIRNENLLCVYAYCSRGSLHVISFENWESNLYPTKKKQLYFQVEIIIIVKKIQILMIIIMMQNLKKAVNFE